MSAISSIEDLCAILIQDLANKRQMMFLIPCERNSTGSCKTKRVRLYRNEKRFAVLLRLLSSIHELLIFNSYATKRDMYYADPTFYGNQSCVDRAIDDICALLQKPRYKLNIMNSSRALVYGDLLCRDQVQGSEIDFRSCSQGVILSLETSKMEIMMCKAKFILVIEKDATFQTILDEDLYEDYKPCLFVTGRGFPDVNLRQFLQKIHEFNTEMPMFALMDADPYGLLIYNVYKFNSKNMKRITDRSEMPTLSTLKLIGLLPSDLSRLHLKEEELIHLTHRDVKALNSMKQSEAYIKDDIIRQEVDCLLKSKKKSELQSLRNLFRTCLCSYYIPMKLKEEGIHPNNTIKQH